MIPVLLALVSAMLFGVAYTFTKKGMDRKADTYNALITSIGVTFVLSAAAALWTSPLKSVVGRQVLPFVAAGVLVPVLSRLLLYMGFSQIGVARTAAVSGTTPLFSAFLALFALGEGLTVPAVAGIVLTVSGIVVISEPHRETKSWKLSGLSLPLASALMFAVRYTLSRYGLFTSPPLVGATITSATSLGVLILGWRLVPHPVLWRLPGAALRFLLCAGLAYTAAYWCLFGAMASEKLAIVVPLIHTDPLWSLLFTHLFLREQHPITPALVAGTCLAVVGSVLIIAGR